MKRHKNQSAGNTILIWKIWYPEKMDEPPKVVDRIRLKMRIQQEKQKEIKLKDNPMTKTFQISALSKSTSKAVILY